ncbi:hypothetical protein ACE193_15215 [Bernardetia sp. OM2101]|uniref:hypothetical protein n=1 Tax=Bernardetia sp. OM2101 TaxID=3344876 RepID=UPI0035CEE67B
MADKFNLIGEKTTIEVEKDKEESLLELAKQSKEDLEKLVKAMKKPFYKQLFKNAKI